MSIRTIAALLVVLALWIRGAFAEPAATQPSRIVMKLHTLNDPGSGNMESHTVLAPAGWTVQGGAWWPPQQCFNILPSQEIKIIAPDGRMVHVGPAIGASDYRPSQHAMMQLGAQRPAEGGVDRGYPIVHRPDSLDDWTTFIENKAFRTTFPTATNVRMEPVVVVPEFTELVQRQLAPIKQQQAQNNQMLGGHVRGSCDGAVLAAKCFYELDGKKYEHLLVFGVTYFLNESQVGQSILWTVEPSVSYRAEEGQLDANMPLLMSIANSARPTPKWAQMKADHSAKMNQIAAKGAADRSAIIANSHREIMKMIVDGDRNRQASNDRSAYNFIKTIREVEDFQGPNDSTPVQLPHHYQHVYSNGAGEYIMTNDSLYNPNTDPLVNNKSWDAMKPVGK
ncbi:MAG: hypothetical protein H7Z14_13025 [Anaerolineae bacterium]|nr:hypothetical protein [Phycisphaerae bacterium]